MSPLSAQARPRDSDPRVPDPRVPAAEGTPVAMPVDLLADQRLTVMGLLAETWSAVSARTTRQLAQAGLSPAEFEVCLRLARSPQGRLRMTDLAAQTTLTSSGITRVVDRLAERGLVRRADCPTDRRTTYAVIRDPGLALLAEVLPSHVEILQAWLLDPLEDGSDGGGDRLEGFLAGLRAVRDHAAPCATAGSAEDTDLPRTARTTAATGG